MIVLFNWIREKGKKFFGFVFVPVMFVCAFLLSFVKPAAAAIDLSDFSLSMTSIETLVPIILIGLAAMWVIRKLVKTTNHT